MSTSLQCTCGRWFRVPSEMDGRRVRCPGCHAVMRVPSVADELADMTECDQRRWIHVRCLCGFIVMGPRCWAEREGRCPHCHQRISLSRNLEVAAPNNETYLVGGEETEAHFTPTYGAAAEDSEGGVATATHTEAATRARADVKTTPPASAAPPPHQPLRDMMGRANRRLRNVGVAAMLVGALTMCMPVLSGVKLVKWMGDRMSTHTPTMPLEAAVKTGNTDEVKANLANGESVSTPDANGLGMLSAACIRGDLGLVTLLVDRGADVNEVDRMGSTPLHWAAGSGRINVVRYLVDHGAGVSAADKKGVTPLREAVTFGQKPVVELLQSLRATM